MVNCFYIKLFADSLILSEFDNFSYYVHIYIFSRQMFIWDVSIDKIYKYFLHGTISLYGTVFLIL